MGEGSAAEKVGLQGITQDQWGRVYIGDILLKIGDVEVNTYDDIYHALDKYRIGDVVDIEFLREDSVRKTKAQTRRNLKYVTYFSQHG